MGHVINDMLIENNLTHKTYSPTLASTATTLNGTLVLTAASDFEQVITGTATGYKVQLPSTANLTLGWKFEIWNISTQQITLVYNDETTVLPVPTLSLITVTLETKATTNGTWLLFRAFTGTAAGILNYTLSASDSFTLTTGTADVLIGGTTPMSVTPIAGTYAVWYNGSIVIVGNNTVVRTSIYKAGVIWTDSLRTIESSVATFNTEHSTLAIIRVNGTEILETRVARSANQLTIAGRSMILIRLGD